MHITTEIDRYWMNQALRQALRGWGRTSPNPMVGAVVVRDNQAVGRGYHKQAGGAHAEVHALAAAGAAAHGATLYVTLEPCSTYRRTPACTEAIAAAGISRVVIGCIDTNPQHQGKGIAWLQQQQIAVTAGIEQQRCQELNEAFFHWIRTGQPFVLLKLATTLDGKIATADGNSQWITGAAARHRVQRLRRWADAIMVGGETLRLDNPRLNVRVPANWPRQPQTYVFSRAAALPPELYLSSTASRTQLVSAETAEQWHALLHEMGQLQITSLLLEGGGELAAAALRAGVVNKIAFFMAAKILGGRGSRGAVGGTDPTSLQQALQVHDLRIERVGNDWLWTGYPQPPAATVLQNSVN